MGLLESASRQGAWRLLSQCGTERGNINKVWPFAQRAAVNGVLNRYIGAGECLLV